MRWSVNFLAAALLAVGNCVPLESELVERAVGTNGSGSSTTSLNYTATLAPKPTSEAPAARGFGHPGPPPNFPPGPPPNFPPGPPNFPAGPPPSFPPGPPNFPPPKKPVKPEEASITCKDPAFQKEKKVVYDFLNSFWTAFLNPNDSVEALKINSTYFTENSLGRVSLTRDFTGVELNTEYIFGLFSDVYDVKFRMNGVPKNYTLVNFVYDNHVAVVSAILDYYIKAIDFHIPIQIDMWYYLVFNDDGTIQIDEYDAVFRNFDWAYEITNGLVLEALHQKFPTKNNTLVYKQLAVDSICTVHTQYCTGENKQYDNYNACYKFLMEDVRIGAAYEGGRDTIFCRNIHQVMLPFRPSVHCPHIGPSGGGMCTDPDTTYNSMLESYSSYFTKLYDSRNHFQ